MFEPILKPKDQPRRREQNPRVLPDGREIFRKPSPKWNARRREIYNRDRGRCVGLKNRPCGRVVTFDAGNVFSDAQIDHVKEKRMGRDAFTDDRAENLRTLCCDCHNWKHDKGEK